MDTSNRPVLSISLLVSNGRLDTIRKCMESLIPLRNEVKCELVVVDTGSKDGSIEIAREYADLVVPFTWCNDFSAARNTGLQKCTGEWFLYLDDDEWFDDVTELIRFFKSGEYKNYEAGWYIQRNYDNFEGTTYTDFYAGRMSKLTDITRFEGKIHEYLAPLPTKVKQFEVFVHHYGYVYRTEEDRQNHLMRNLVLEEAAVAENPEDIRMCCQLVQEYRAARRFEDAECWCKQVLKDSVYGEENSFYQYLMVTLPKILSEKDCIDEAIEEYEKLEKKDSLYPMARMAVYLEKAILYGNQNRFDLALDAILNFFKITDGRSKGKQGHPVMDFAYYLSPVAEQKAIRIGLFAMINENRYELAEYFLKKIDWKKHAEQRDHFIRAVFQIFAENRNEDLFLSEVKQYLAITNDYKIFRELAGYYWENYPHCQKAIAKVYTTLTSLEEGDGFFCMAGKHYNGQSLEAEAKEYYSVARKERDWKKELLFLANTGALPVVLANVDMEEWEELVVLYCRGRKGIELADSYNEILTTKSIYLNNQMAFFHMECGIVAEKLLLFLTENSGKKVTETAENADIISDVDLFESVFAEYIFHFQNYSELMYSEAALTTEELCVLPKRLRFVGFMSGAAGANLAEWGRCAKKAAQAYPVMLPVVRVLLNNKSKQEKEKDTMTNTPVNAEMKALSEQMRVMILGQIQAGQMDEAKALLTEVEQILPGEEWVLKLVNELQ